ncbi:MAG TPA: hypothetical protein VFB66_07715 [Tepidisphaeraceae bacterium]|nr:hypothetical protein [Tepidisphaeraceae bacterium]
MVLNQLSPFVANWRKMRLTDEDLRGLELAAMEDPEGWPVIPGTGGVRKMRFAPPSWATGKSGATRVIYAYFPAFARLYFVTIYGKGRKSDLSVDERKVIRELVRRIDEALKRGVSHA